MTIQKDKAVYIDYTLTNDKGDVLDTSKDAAPLAYLHGHKNIVPGLESELEGKAKGDKLKVAVAPKDGYGERRDDLVQEVPITQFDQPDQALPGAQFHIQGPEGVLIATVKKVEGETVTMDLNHPLSGETLNFDVTIADVRDASAEELEHGHIHGAGGHEH